MGMEEDQQQRMITAQRTCQQDADIDFDSNRRAHYRAVLRGLYGLKNDLFYDPQGFEDIEVGQSAQSPEKGKDPTSQNSDDDEVDLIDHYSTNFAELSRMLALGQKSQNQGEEDFTDQDKYDPVQRLAILKKDVRKDLFKKFGFQKMDIDFLKEIRENEQ